LIFFQERLLLFTGNSTNLLLQISELNELRKQLRKAEQSAEKVRQTGAAEKSANIERSAHP
jgi:hypothetical protein